MNLARTARIAAGLSQRKLADLLGVNRMTVMRWEKNSTEIPPVAKALLRVLVEMPTETLAILRAAEISERAEAVSSSPGSDGVAHGAAIGASQASEEVDDGP